MTKQPEIDWSALSLPTDAVMVGDVRRRNPEVFGHKHRGTDTPLQDLLVFETLATEMDLAQAAFDRALGRPGPLRGGLTPADLQGEPVEHYARLGIDEGDHSRKTLARRVETDAAAQAGRFASRGK